MKQIEADHATQLSYSGLHASNPELRSPETLEELRQVLAEAVKTGRRITLRGGGMSLDSQSIANDLALIMTHFKHISLDESQQLLTVGAGARWGHVLDFLKPYGLVPRVMVSTQKATIGGTLSTNALSRFSCIYGREGLSIRSLKLMTADGELHTCSRAQNAELFFAVIGGFGNLGVVTEASYQLMKREKPVQVETHFKMREGVEGLANSLLPGPDAELAKCAVLSLHEKSVLQLYTTSRYTSGSWLKRIPLYRPVDLVRIFAEMASYYWPWVASFIWKMGFKFILKDGTAYRDPLRGFTFFTDGNVAARKRILKRSGRYRMLEQTYIIPKDGELERFILSMVDACNALGFHPLLFDVTWLPEDEAFLLSSTNNMAGYAVNIAFVGTNDRETDQVINMFSELSEQCFHQGGRVHLTKNIFAKTTTMQGMYKDQLEAFIKLRERIDPNKLFGSGFLERVMGLEDS